MIGDRQQHVQRNVLEPVAAAAEIAHLMDEIEAEPIDVDPVMTGTAPVAVDPADLAQE